MNKPMRDFVLETFMSKWEFTAKYTMTASDAESMRLPDLLAMASDEDREDFETLSLGYTETFGAPALRQEIARTYDTVQPDELICFAGAEEAIYVAMKVLLTSDDHAIVITPNYQAAETLPLSICAVTGVALDIDDDWNLEPQQDRSRDPAEYKADLHQFPQQPDRQDPAARGHSIRL